MRKSRSCIEENGDRTEEQSGGAKGDSMPGKTEQKEIQRIQSKKRYETEEMWSRRCGEDSLRRRPEKRSSVEVGDAEEKGDRTEEQSGGEASCREVRWTMVTKIVSSGYELYKELKKH